YGCADQCIALGGPHGTCVEGIFYPFGIIIVRYFRVMGKLSHLMTGMPITAYDQVLTLNLGEHAAGNDSTENLCIREVERTKQVDALNLQAESPQWISIFRA